MTTGKRRLILGFIVTCVFALGAAAPANAWDAALLRDPSKVIVHVAPRAFENVDHLSAEQSFTDLNRAPDYATVIAAYEKRLQLNTYARQLDTNVETVAADWTSDATGQQVIRDCTRDAIWQIPTDYNSDSSSFDLVNEVQQVQNNTSTCVATYLGVGSNVADAIGRDEMAVVAQAAYDASTVDTDVVGVTDFLAVADYYTIPA